MDDAGAGQARGDEDGEQLGEPNGGRGLQDVQILQDVGHGHQPQGTQEAQPDPVALQVDGHEAGRNGEEVDEAAKENWSVSDR